MCPGPGEKQKNVLRRTSPGWGRPGVGFRGHRLAGGRSKGPVLCGGERRRVSVSQGTHTVNDSPYKIRGPFVGLTHRSPTTVSEFYSQVRDLFFTGSGGRRVLPGWFSPGPWNQVGPRHVFDDLGGTRQRPPTTSLTSGRRLDTRLLGGPTFRRSLLQSVGDTRPRVGERCTGGSKVRGADTVPAEESGRTGSVRVSLSG